MFWWWWVIEWVGIWGGRIGGRGCFGLVVWDLGVFVRKKFGYIVFKCKWIGMLVSLSLMLVGIGFKVVFLRSCFVLFGVSLWWWIWVGWLGDVWLGYFEVIIWSVVMSDGVGIWWWIKGFVGGLV